MRREAGVVEGLGEAGGGMDTVNFIVENSWGTNKILKTDEKLNHFVEKHVSLFGRSGK